jgi:LuxR family maltose regulon positive regulatory protein
LAEAQDWVVDQDLSVDDELSFLREFDHVTLTRVFIAQYKSSRDNDSIHNAMGLAERLLQAAENGKRIRSVIEILILQALAHEAQGDTPAALKSLERALTLAEPEGFVGIFVDEGPPMASLLYEALKREIAPAYVQRLLAAFPVAESQGAPPTESQVDQSELIEPLSEREIEVLQLLAKGLSNQAVADRLVLSIHTVKAHTRSIYSKLAVNNRTQAVDRARTLGVLPPI